jgi:hypothetical protein
MSFTHLRHDSCAYKHQLLESIGPGEYMLDTSPATHCKPCFVPSSAVRMQRVAPSQCGWQNQVDVDSELMGLTKRASRCPTQARSLKTVCETVGLSECNELDPESSRLSNPPCLLRGTGWQRWDFLCQDPQKCVERPFAFNVSNRLLSKDNFKPCISRPNWIMSRGS